MTDTTSGAQMVTALVRLRAALQGAVLPLELPGVEEHRLARTEMVDQLEDYVIPRIVTLEAPLLAVVGGSTGAGKSTLVNSLVGRGRHRVRRAPADDPLAGAGAQPRRRRLVRRRPAAARARAGPPPDPRPAGPAARRPRRRAPGAGDPRRSRHRLRRGEQPPPRRPAARRRRPVALRHLGGALRRPGAVGLPAPGRRAVGRRRDRARPDARPTPSGPSRPTWPGCSPRVGSRTHRSSPSTRPALDDDGLLPPREVAEIRRWLTELGRRRRRPRRDGAADARGRDPLADPAGPHGRRRLPRAGRRCRAAPRHRRRGVRRGAAQAPRGRPPTAPCCAARCWCAGRSSSAPASC